jgi:ribosomal-protein-alanine N-acetyltransferase
MVGLTIPHYPTLTVRLAIFARTVSHILRVMSMGLIRGNRIALRHLVLSDAAAMLALYRRNALFLSPWEPARPDGFYSLAYHQEMIRTGQDDDAHDRAYTFGLLLQESGELIGRLRLSNVVRGVFQNAYLGYWLDEARTGHGYMTEAVELALANGFGPLRLHRVQAATLLHNHASRSVLTKNGFRQEGLAERYLFIDGQWQDHLIFAITNEEWTVKRSRSVGGNVVSDDPLSPR